MNAFPRSCRRAAGSTRDHKTRSCSGRYCHVAWPLCALARGRHSSLPLRHRKRTNLSSRGRCPLLTDLTFELERLLGKLFVSRLHQKGVETAAMIDGLEGI